MSECFNLEEDRVKREIIKRNAKRVLIQIPEGLRRQVFKIVETVENAGAEAVVSADPCYGACDLALEEAKKVNADLIIHYGHTELLHGVGFPVIYIEAEATIPVEEVIKKSLSFLKDYHRIGLVTTTQHLNKLPEVKEILLENGKEVSIGHSNSRLSPGQVIGCNFRNAVSISGDVDAFLFVGGGRFHALGVALSTSKPTYVADPYLNSVYSVDEEARKIIRQRFASIVEARKAENFGVIVSLKTGQLRFNSAVEIAEMLRDEGKKVTILTLREITPEVLSQFPTIEAYVNTACPRVSLDDASRFNVPILTISETLVLLGKLSWEDLCKGGLFVESSWKP